MRTKVFDCPALRLHVSQMDDGSTAWQGSYKGTTIKTAIPIDGDCVILLDPDATDARVFRNLLRISRDGRQRWRAELPGTPDVFLDVHREGNSLAAHTWSGYSLRIDPASGKCLREEFVK